MEEKVQYGKPFKIIIDNEMYQCLMYYNYYNFTGKLEDGSTSHYVKIRKINKNKFLWWEYDSIEWFYDYFIESTTMHDTNEKVRITYINDTKYYDIKDVKKFVKDGILRRKQEIDYKLEQENKAKNIKHVEFIK